MGKLIGQTLVFLFLSTVPTTVFSACVEGLFESPVLNKCVGPHPNEDLQAYEKPMTFKMKQISISSMGTWVAAEGIITKETPDEFRKFAKREGLRTENRIEFNSPGGNLYAALILGRMIRELGNATTVRRSLMLDNPGFSLDVIELPGAGCYSACAYAFLGGGKRYFSGDSSFGVHRFGSSEYEVTGDEAQKVTSDISQYIEEMGVDQRLLQLAARSSFEDDIFLINSTMAEELRVVFDPSDKFSRFEIFLLSENVVANTTIFHKGYEYSARLHCIDGFPKLVVWGPHQNFPQIFHDMPRAITKFISGGGEFFVATEAGTLKNGNAFVAFVGADLAIQLVTNGELHLDMVWPPNWDQLDFVDKIRWMDMATWFKFNLRVENAADTVPIVLRECH